MTVRENQPICQNPEVSASLADLECWFSVPRMETFSSQKNPVDLYLWNAQLAKAFLEDIEHFEVLLRNWIDRCVAKAWGERWYDNINSPSNPAGLNFNSIDKRGIAKAKRRVGEADPPPGRVIAELTLDFWVHIFDNRHSATIHPKLISAIKHRHSIEEFAGEIQIVYRLRNRCAHHEPLVKADRIVEAENVDRALRAIEDVTSWISPDAGRWIMGNSRVRGVYARRP
ncbi:Abi family protein [uncultured Corynebacterium sp.]|uniref:Abi family protein n=1 Tax=uncultured Corynebacterium sp. TaxID=159447 RepID=UPI002597E0B8|nr:Abi family protein [uncultured Corynebacterium sp.]